MNVVLRRAAERDVEEAALWYEQQSPGLGIAFIDSVAQCLSGMIRNPEAHPVVMDSIRRALLRRFPYGLFYLVEGDRLVVVGCFHVRRSPRRWTKRS